jgi:uncharacterized protein (TIGR02466 family)
MPEKMLFPLFSKPVFSTYVDVSNIDLSEVEWLPNYENSISKSQFVLSDPKFDNLLTHISREISEYFYGIMSASQDVEIYITESWFNKTEPGQTHHRHWHPNSILSGVVYLQSEGDTGKIKFITSQYDVIEFNTVESNLYNSRSWSVLPTAGSMVIFPSSVEHRVEPYHGTIPRISLSFNTFVKGNINKSPLTKLSI